MEPSPQRREHNSSNTLVQILARDIISVAFLGLLLLFIHTLGQPFIRGFYCDDETIRYPHHDSTVPSSVCYLVGSGTNVLLILILEYFHTYHQVKSMPTRLGSDQLNLLRYKIYMRNVYCRITIWLFGAIASELLTDISKFSAGRLRPHFIDVCKPEIGFNNANITVFCSDPSNRLTYITGYRCTGQPSMQRDARLSFMSGHSSYSAYSASFAIFYLQSAMDISKYGLLKPSLQVLIAAAAFYTGLTRVSDYKHHWQDVLVGLSQGSVVGAIAATRIWPAFRSAYSKFPKTGLETQELSPVSY